jgi:DNA-binding MarR family transcriptional regulator
MATRSSAADTTRLWECLHHAHNVLTAALEKDLVPEAGIPLAWYEVLHHLSQAEGGLMRFQELARISGITDSGASRRLNHMIRAGLIDRQSCPTDRRGVYAHITDAGRDSYRRTHAVFVRSLKKNLSEHLSAGEADSLRVALERL